MNDGFEMTLTEETEKKLYEIMYSMDVKNTPRFWIKDKRGYSAFYEKVIHCKDCKAYNGMKCVRNNMIAVREDDFCSRGESEEE